MTATVDQKTILVRQLISSCRRAQEGYRWAASTVTDETLKRLFELYAQQRTRFAEELREYLPIDTPADLLSDSAAQPEMRDGGVAEQKSIKECLEMDAHTLKLYRETVARRTLPVRAQFLISSQLALMQRVHDRMQLMMMNKRSAAQPRFQTQRVSA